jgi:holin-like protein
MLLQKGVQLARSLIILYIMLLLGNLISHYIPVGIPGSIWGLLLLFLGLTTHVIHLEWIYFGSSLLIRYMAVLFVPVSVGIIKYYDLLVATISGLAPKIMAKIAPVNIENIEANATTERIIFHCFAI